MLTVQSFRAKDAVQNLWKGGKYSYKPRQRKLVANQSIPDASVLVGILILELHVHSRNTGIAYCGGLWGGELEVSVIIEACRRPDP